jgi:hypothetical protein
MFKTGTGLKHIELVQGDPSASKPRYGQLCIISYAVYFKLPLDKEKQKFDSAEGH